ncbi:hypothetical protein K2P97_04360 [bacterium]|nr:hypothetical protein [bacterium]
MNVVRIGLFAALLFSFYTSCAPVKFTKSNNINANVSCSGSACAASAITCDPKINTTLTTFTYTSLTSGFPTISSNCSPSTVDYNWVVKRADSSVVATAIPGLTGTNPSNVDFTVLGAGNYYVFLNATQTGGGLNPFNAATPLEFVVPGPGVGNSLTCDPKLNSTFTSVVVAAADPNPVVSSNCAPLAGTYLWTATKDGSPFVISGLSGASSTPNIKSYGAGTYRIYLYATLTGSVHWQSSTPLVVTIQDPPPVITAIDCNPRINGSLTNLTLTTASPYPLISGNCLPSNVQYTWTVTKNGSNVSIPGLSGSNSNPDFLSSGTGTYLIYLTASAPGYSSWNTTTPLTITVDTIGSGLTLNCAPRLNNTSVAVTVTPSGSNPLVTSGCNPSTVTHNWSVFKAGSSVAISGLSGASSTADFIGAGLGTYFIYLTASSPGYNSYVSPSPLEVTVAPANTPVREVIYERLVTPSDNKVDLLVVVDDSNSMAPENTRLAQRLQAFVGDLTASGLDWQMCATVTRSQDVYNNGTYYWGASRNWVGYVGSPQWILKTGAADPYSIFTNTMSAIGAGWAGTDDERGIKAAFWSIEYAEYNNCYRNDASLAVILISDEDVRSVGGNSSLQYYSGEYKNLEADDQPQGLVNKVKQEFGLQKRFTFNSIIVKPGDSTCMTAQDAAGSKSHYGYKYNEISQLTGGATASICDADYSNNLYYFKDRIINTQASVALECAPVGPVAVTITPAMAGVTTQIQNNTLVFNPAVPAGRTIRLVYNCPRN